MCMRQPLAEHEFGKCCSFACEELVDIAWGHPLARRDSGQLQIAVAEVGGNVGFYRLEPCRPYAAPLAAAAASRVAPGLSANQIMNMGHHQMTQHRRGEYGAGPDSSDIIG